SIQSVPQANQWEQRITILTSRHFYRNLSGNWSPPKKPRIGCQRKLKLDESCESQILQFHMDVTRSVQVVLEEILLEKGRYFYSRIPVENLCMAGHCKSWGLLRHLFVRPAARDAGGAIGAAAVAHVQITGS